MERYDEIMDRRKKVFNIYHEGLKELEKQGKLKRQVVPQHIEHNAHMYNIVLPTNEIRSNVISKLKEAGIMAYICYVPLHSAPMGIKLGYTPEMLPVTEDVGARTLRLPLYADMTLEEAKYVVNKIIEILQ